LMAATIPFIIVPKREIRELDVLARAKAEDK
jgi:hypothetical protein